MKGNLPVIATRSKLLCFLDGLDRAPFEKHAYSKKPSIMMHDLADALIRQVGSIDDFLDSYSTIADYQTNNLAGLISIEDKLGFFEKNKELLLDYVKRSAFIEGVGSAIELVHNWSMINEPIDIDTIAAALHETASTEHSTTQERTNIYTAIVGNAMIDICDSFMTYVVRRAEINAIKTPDIEATQEHLNRFLSSHESGLTEKGAKSTTKWSMNRELACALVKHLDAGDSFLDNYSDVLHKSDHDLNGFYFANSTLGFYDDNKENLLDNIMRKANRKLKVGGVIEFINDSIDLPEIDMDAVAKALYEPAGNYKDASCARSIVCMHIARTAATELCINFLKFMKAEAVAAK